MLNIRIPQIDVGADLREREREEEREEEERERPSSRIMEPVA